MTIGKLAQRGGVNLETIRYYERLGLLPKPPRSRSGYRLFPADAPRRVRFIKRTQALGFSLKEIKELLALRIAPDGRRADVRKRAEAKISDIDQKIRSLRKMRESLAEITKVCCGEGPINDCPILENLNHEE